MMPKYCVLAALGVAAALAAFPSPPSWARRARTASRKARARHKTASPAPQKYLQMHVSSELAYRNPLSASAGASMFGSKRARAAGESAGESASEKRGAIEVDFEAAAVHLSAQRYWVDKTQIHLLGNAAIACEAGGKPLSINGEQLQLTWGNGQPHSDTVIEAQIDAGMVNDTNEAGDESGAKVSAEAKPLSFSETAIPLAAKPVSLLLRMLQDEASTHGRHRGAAGYADGAPFTVARYVVKFQGFSFSADWGGYSEDGQIIYDQRTRAFFLQARTRRTEGKATLVQLTLADVTMARLSTLLQEGHGAISFTKPTLSDALIKLGARQIKRSLTSSAYK